jgi:hypothetical protein
MAHSRARARRRSVKPLLARPRRRATDSAVKLVYRCDLGGDIYRPIRGSI